MITAEYLKEPPEREKLIVEHATKHTVVLKPGFYNRRNQSQFLKNAYPAGFQIKSKFTDRLGNSIIREGGVSNPYGSFTEWTKGETDTLADSVSADLTDPYADVAGPYLADILANRPTVQKQSGEFNNFNSMVAKELPLHNRSKKANKPKPRANSPSKVQVFNAPTLMPTFTPALSQSKVVNNLVPANTTAYNSWLAFQRSDMAEKLWLIKGNDADHNYSAHDFNGERATTSQLLAAAAAQEQQQLRQASSSSSGAYSPPPSAAFCDSESLQLGALRAVYPSILSDVPKPLPPYLTVEVHTLNQMVRTDRLSDEKHITRVIDSRLSLAELKALITEDIVTGIEKAFHLYENKSNARGRRRLDYTKVDLTFQCFSAQAHAWRPVASEVDWIQAKQNCRDPQQPDLLRVMYALEKRSEFLLLREIQASYQRQQEAERLRAAPQISLKALTESMEQDLRLRKKYVFTDSPTGSPKRIGSAHAQSLKGSRPPTGSSSMQQQQRSALSMSTGALPTAGSQSPGGYFLPLGQNAVTLAALSSTRNSAVSTPNDLSRSSRKPSRLLDSLSRTGSSGLHGGQDTISAHAMFGAGSASASATTTPDISASIGRNTSSAALLPTSTLAASFCASQGSRSIFYPKRSDTLDKMYEQLESSIPRQQDFANSLEQRLFKTKW